MLNLHKNGLWGDVGSLMAGLRNVEHVDLSDNMFFGRLEMGEDDIWILVNIVKHMNLSYNKLNGKFFEANAMSLLRSLEVLDLGYNQLRGELPSFGLMASLQILRVGSNQLFGSIPQELFESLVPLEELDLSGNGFSGNRLLIFQHDMPSGGQGSGAYSSGGHHHNSKASIKVAIIVASIGAAVMIAFVLLAYYRAQIHEFHGRAGFGSETTGRDASWDDLLVQRGTDPPPASLSFSNDHLLTSHSRSIPGQRDFVTETVEHGLPERFYSFIL